MKAHIPLLLLLASRLAAQDTTVTLWTRDSLKSAKLNEQRSIYVAVPDGYRSGAKNYPVLVILDAEDQAQFRLAIAHVAYLANRASIPELIVVGIPNGKDRTHDLTPSPNEAGAKKFPTAGGVSAFADFIIDEVMPFVRARYRTTPMTIVAGHSFGGLLALEIAAKRPGYFTGVIAMSPALWWNDSSLVVSYSDALAKVSKPERLFVTSGGYEVPIDRPTSRFAKRLDSLKPTAVVFGHQRYANDSHGMTPASSLVDGLRFIFDPIAVDKLPLSTLGPDTDSAMMVNAVTDSRRRYAAGARILGVDERLPENQLNDMGYATLGFLKNPPLAVWVFRQNVELYPESPNVYDSLADALLATRDTTGAIREYRRAIELATRTKHPILEESKRKLKSLEANRAKPK